MSDDFWRRREIDSPCVNICAIHPVTGYCAGCHRTADEIAQWSAMTGDARQGILLELPKRAAEHQKRRGGRAGRKARDS